MAEESNVILNEESVEIVGGGSPIVDVKSGNNWDLANNDGDLRIGKNENELKIGVATDGNGAGNVQIWANRGNLKLGALNEPVLKIDDGGVHAHNGTYNLGRPDSEFHDAWLDGNVYLGPESNRLTLGNERVRATDTLGLGVNDSDAVTVDGQQMEPNLDEYGLGSDQNRWFTTHFDRSNVNVLNVEEGVISSLIPVVGDGEFSLPTPNLGSEANRWGTLWAHETQTTSDRRLKSDIETYEGGLDAVLDLRPVSFSYRRNGDETHLGLIGQEVADVLPEVVTVPDDNDGYLGMDYSELVAVLVDAIQAQHAETETLERRVADQTERIEAQQAEIDDQQERIDDLENRLAALEQAV